MKLELSYPYCNDWRLGYLRESKDGRKRVDLFNSNTDRTTVAYARYLMACQVGRYLTDEEEVDHIDQDNSNDELSNLQILSVEEHRKKNSKEQTTGRTMVVLICDYCGTSFEREKRNVKYSRSFCNRSCSGRFKGT